MSISSTPRREFLEGDRTSGCVDGNRRHKREEVERGFNSMIEVLRKNRRDIKAEALLRDWSQIKAKFLEGKANVQ